MLAPSTLPNEYRSWNQTHGAPFGPQWWIHLLESKYYGQHAFPFALGRVAWRLRMKFPRWLMTQLGPFAFQRNSRTRTYEYPWCFHATLLLPGMRVVEIGPGASGFQFVLAQEGLQVTSIDPLVNPSEKVDWMFSTEEFQRLNAAFGHKVEFIRDTIEDAQLPADSYDRVFAVSALEHIPEKKVLSILQEVRRILKPGGLFIATVDLFLDCFPFGDQMENQYGRNISIRKVVEASGLVLTAGLRSQLCGYPEFDPGQIAKNKDDFLVAQQVMSQCFVLEKTTA